MADAAVKPGTEDRASQSRDGDQPFSMILSPFGYPCHAFLSIHRLVSVNLDEGFVQVGKFRVLQLASQYQYTHHKFLSINCTLLNH